MHNGALPGILVAYPVRRASSEKSFLQNPHPGARNIFSPVTLIQVTKSFFMKNQLLTLLMICPALVIGQKNVDLDRYKVRVQFRSLPAIQLDSSYHTYSVDVEGSRMMQSFLQDGAPERTIDLKGWRKLPELGHLQVKVKLEDLLPESISVKERVEQIKNRSGQITGTRVLYQQQVVYSFAATAVISDYRGMHIMDEVLANRENKQVFNSPEFAFKKMA